jgi:hypothetical protein
MIRTSATVGRRSARPAARSRTQITRLGATRSGHAGDQVAVDIGRIRCGPRTTRQLRTVSETCCRQGGGGTADRTSAKAAKVTAVLSKRCRAVLTERRR